MGSEESAIGKGPIGPGGPGPRDPHEGLKALFLSKLEEWWREIAYKDAISPTADTAAKTGPPRLRPTRDTSRSAAVSSSDETEGFVAVARRRRGGTRRKGRRPEAQPLPTTHAPSRNVRFGERTSSSLPLSPRKQGSRYPGRWIATTTTVRDQRRGRSPRWSPRGQRTHRGSGSQELRQDKRAKR
jgi:hypothetical protein